MRIGSIGLAVVIGGFSSVLAAAPPGLVTDPSKVLAAERFPETEWAEALEAGDKEAAKAAFVERLRKGEPRSDRAHNQVTLYREWFGREIPRGDADQMLDHRYTGVYDITYQFEDGIDWMKPVTREMDRPYTRQWQIQFNRHYHWPTFADAYERTGKSKYAGAWEAELRSWLDQCPRPDGKPKGFPAAWRGLELGIRLSWTWPYVLGTFRKSEAVSDEALWWMVCSMRQQAVHLRDYPFFEGRPHNIGVMEAQGLVYAATVLPEMRGAPSVARKGVERLRFQMERSAYPDGSHTELAPSYGVLVVVCGHSAFRQLDTRADAWGPEDDPPATGDLPWGTLYDMAEAFGKLAQPSGRVPTLHDSWPFTIGGVYDTFEKRKPARFAERPWRSGRSTLLPWGGYGVLRRDGRWSMLDAGPWGGSGHRHDDPLQVLMFAGGEPLLVDSGKPLYEASKVHWHLRRSEAHNVVQTDGRVHQEAKPVAHAKEPLPIAFHGEGPVQVTAATRTLRHRGKNANEQPRFDHERLLLDITGVGVVVFDRLRPGDGGAHRWSWLWHTPVERIETGDAGATLITEDGPKLRVQPVLASGDALRMKSVSGQKKPSYQGWHREGNEVVPSPALVVETANDRAATRAATLLVPLDGDGSAGTRIEAVEANDGTTVVRIAASDGDAHRLTFVGDADVTKVRYELADGRSGAFELEDHRR